MLTQQSNRQLQELHVPAAPLCRGKAPIMHFIVSRVYMDVVAKTKTLILYNPEFGTGMSIFMLYFISK
jgi:hypothetical protein